MVGGIASYIVNSTQYAPADQVFVYAPHVSRFDEAYDTTHPWRVIRHKQQFTYWWPRWLKMIFHCYRIIRKEHITHVHIHHVLPSGYLGWLFKRWLGIGYTIFFHGSDVVLSQKLQKINQLRLVVRDADSIVVNSHYLEGALKELIPNHPPLRVVHPCPSKEFINYAPTAAEIAVLKERLALSSKRVLLSVGRMVEGKGYEQLLEIFPKLLARFPNLIWVIAGTGPLEKKISDRARELQVVSAIRFVGSLPVEHMRTLYSIADIFILLTHKTDRSTEAFGTVFLEAAAAALPVIAGAGGGVDEAIDHKKTGIIVDVNHPQEIIDSVIRLFEHPELGKELGRAGRVRVLEEFTWEKQLQGSLLSV